jgi:hypothetical protein
MLEDRSDCCQVSEVEDKDEKSALPPVVKLIEFSNPVKFINRNPVPALYSIPQLFAIALPIAQ